VPGLCRSSRALPDTALERPSDPIMSPLVQGKVRPSVMERSMAALFAVIGALFLLSAVTG